jgi:superfamily II DNA or RNA helicase
MSNKNKSKMDRTERQIQGLKQWKIAGFTGIAQYPTGFGKTYTAIQAIKGMIVKKDIKSVLVVVPTIELKHQWNKELALHKITIAEVLVINTAVKSIHNVDFLILDEIHRYAAETFKEIFRISKYKYIMGLTATLEREDGLHDIILEQLEVFDQISVNDALKNGWISPYEIYNIAVPFSNEDAIAYKKSDNSFKHFAAKLGRGGAAFQKAQEYLKSGDKTLQGLGGAYFNSMRTRKKICLNNSNKINITKSIIDLLSDRNGLIFSATTEFADSLQEKLGDISMTFHSKLTKKQQEQVIKRFKDKRTKVRMLSSVKALNEGFNVPECSLAIIAGSNSTKRTFIQQLGRVVRYQPDKKAIIINLYTPDTQEEKWLKKRTEEIELDVIHFMTLERFLNKFKKDE